MKAMSTRFIALALGLSLLAITVAAQKKPVGRKPSGLCSAGEISFPCPKGLKVLRQDKESGSFLAQRKEKDYSYSIFVVTGDSENVEKRIDTDFVPLLFPTEPSGYVWRELEFLNTAPTSTFEIKKRLAGGFNQKYLISLSYREISFKSKKFTIGSIWHEDGSVADAKEVFEQATGMVEGSGCDQIVKLIHLITGEKTSKKSNPCEFELIQTLGNPDTKK